ncbi:MAG TPA: hypothetical protein VD884_01300 [Ohtaekwangia sp.]|nr:hypothetical protein [Ohtaekwangia sp.]
MTSHFKNGKWTNDSSETVASAGEIIFTNDDLLISAGSGEGACRLLLLFEAKLKKASILHFGSRSDTEEIDALLRAIKVKKFNKERTEVFLAGDVVRDEDSHWNLLIANALQVEGYKSPDIFSQGRQTGVYVNPKQNFILVTDAKGRQIFLRDENMIFDQLKEEGAFLEIDPYS